MESIIGTSIGVFIGITLVIMGYAAFVTGQAVAATWRPVWQGLAYCLLMGLADRFLIFALFDGELLSITGYIFDTAVLMGYCLLGYRITRVKTMVNQYPWLYERAGLLGWREREGGGG